MIGCSPLSPDPLRGRVTFFYYSTLFPVCKVLFFLRCRYFTKKKEADALGAYPSVQNDPTSRSITACMSTSSRPRPAGENAGQ